ncbi:hypothetical protein SAMN04488516_11727 [Desulfonauticus submarinus]|uniref:Mu-like prophage I protein n=1 Tax=Desulfonauticus submarinus TaxID=206665 RepID=A0A1H0GAQ8_9BACT|nr:hypothetical protein [Desulfonauticus submarinus]SDO03960.1 hypothetical protein SAMN04488516_11727 [Desulfonauticus submarinus]
MWIPVFKKGKWTDLSGNTKEWTDKDLETIVEKYNSQNEHEAPVVLGHPKDDSPAYGWVEKLKKEGDLIYAKLKDVSKEFVDWVKKGFYKKRSIALYPDLLLRHVGFLGGTPPAVKGLPDVSFSSSDFVSLEFSEADLAEKISIIGELFQKIREFFIEKYGKEEVDKVVPSWDVDILKNTPQESTQLSEGQIKLNKQGYNHAKELIAKGKINKTDKWSFDAEDENKILGDPPDWKEYKKWFLAEETGQGEETKQRYKYPFGKNGKVYRSALIAIRQRAAQQKQDNIFEAAGKLLEQIDKEDKKMQEFEEIKKKYDELEKKNRQMQEQLKKQEIQGFLDKLSSENKLPPKFLEMGIGEFISSLDSEQEIEFSEGEKKSPKQWFMEFLEKLPEAVPLGQNFKEGKDKSLDEEVKLGKEIANSL